MRVAMSVLDGFVRIRLYRKQAAEFQWLADNAQIRVCGDVTAACLVGPQQGFFSKAALTAH